MTIADSLHWAAAQLQGNSDSPRTDAEVLLAFALGVSRAHLYTWPEQVVQPAAMDRVRALIDRRASGMPVAYLTGRREFWSLPLDVSEATLIPRPETELLVELALARLPRERAVAVADLGTGSGAIALAIASERPLARIAAVERSRDALEVARRNCERLGLEVDLLQGDWYAPLAGRRFDLIVANPPYIGADELKPSLGDCRFEPRQALVADAAGLAALRHIIEHAPAHLQPAAWLLVEHGYRQGRACRKLFERAGFTDVASTRDLQGHERVTGGRRGGSTA